MCDVLGCDSPPEFHPVLLLRTQGGTVRVIVGLKICLVCKPKAKALGVLQVAEWIKIHQSLGAHPDNTRYDWCRLKSKEARQFASATRRN